MRARRAGGAALEFAVTLPVLLVLLAGVIEWGWFLHQEVSVVQATRDGALGGALTPVGGDPAAGAVSRTRAALQASGLDGVGADVVASVEESDVGELVRVQASTPYTPLLHLLPTPDRLRGESAFLLVRP